VSESVTYEECVALDSDYAVRVFVLRVCLGDCMQRCRRCSYWCRLTVVRRQWRRQSGGRGGEASPYGWTSKNYVICVCFHCHGSSSYHTTNTKPYRFPMHCSKCVSFWGTSYSRPPIDPVECYCCLLEFRCLQNTSDNLCGEISKNQTREICQTLMKHED